MYKPNTLKDIADGLGLSISTVSRALSDSYQISEKTKRIVKEKATHMNYKPNPFAVSLKNARNYSIGVVISSVNNVFFSQVIDGIESVAYKKGYHIIITQSHDSTIREAENIGHLMNSRVDGILMSLAAGTINYSHINEYQSKGNPMVFFDRVLTSGNAHKVVSNNFKGAYDGTGQLLKDGCKRVMFLGTVEHLSIIEQRKLGYQHALAHYNLKADEECVRYCGFDNDYKDQIRRILEELLMAGKMPDAIFGACESTTFGCMQVLKNLKLDGAIKIAGFSNTKTSDLMRTAPHFIKQNAFKMGVIATEKLIYSIENAYRIEKYETVTLETVSDSECCT